MKKEGIVDRWGQINVAKQREHRQKRPLTSKQAAGLHKPSLPHLLTNPISVFFRGDVSAAVTPGKAK